MEENQAGKEHRSDDLDLITLFEKIFSFSRNYGKMISVFSLIGVTIGLTFYFFSSKQYASSLLLHSFTLTNTEHINIIENWDNLLKDHEYTVLGERLNCNPEMLKKLTSISATEIQKLYIPNNPNGFMIEVMVKDNEILDSLGKGIVYGLENSDYIKAKLASKRSNLTQLTDKVKSELIKLDSTKKDVEFSINNNNQHSSSYIIDISTINSQVIALSEKLLSFQDELKFTSCFFPKLQSTFCCKKTINAIYHCSSKHIKY